MFDAYLQRRRHKNRRWQLLEMGETYMIASWAMGSRIERKSTSECDTMSVHNDDTMCVSCYGAFQNLLFPLSVHRENKRIKEMKLVFFVEQIKSLRIDGQTTNQFFFFSSEWTVKASNVLPIDSNQIPPVRVEGAILHLVLTNQSHGIFTKYTDLHIGNVSMSNHRHFSLVLLGRWLGKFWNSIWKICCRKSTYHLQRWLSQKEWVDLTFHDISRSRAHTHAAHSHHIQSFV